MFNEIEKIKSLFQNKKINEEQVLDLLNEENNLNFDYLRDTCLEGDARKLNKSLGIISLQNENIFFYLNNLNQRVQKLSMLIKQNEKDKNIDYALDNLKPKVFWKDKPIILRQVRKWNYKKLEMVRKTILEVEIIMKTKISEKIEDPNIVFVRNELESRLGLNVEIMNKKNNSGKVVIKYKTLDQFELISKLLTRRN